MVQHHKNSNKLLLSGLLTVLFKTSATCHNYAVIFLFASDNTDFTMGSISAANAEFSFDVFKELKVQHANENIFYSPLSIIAALAMVYLGARGNTEYQMEKVSYIHAYKLLLILFNPATDGPCTPLGISPVEGRNSHSHIWHWLQTCLEKEWHSKPRGLDLELFYFHVLLLFPMRGKNGLWFPLRQSSLGECLRQVSCFSLYFLTDLIPFGWKVYLVTHKR